MGVGHLAVGFAAKRWAPRTSLGWLVLAPIFVDLLWGIFILTGIEHARITPGITRVFPFDLEWIPISHSLVADFGWALLVSGIYFALHKNLRVALILFGGVLSHWLLDFIAHRPDMPLLPNGPKVGLALWNHPMPSLCVETAMLALGVWLYLSATRPRNGGGKIGLAIAVVFLFAFNLAAYLGPMPSSIIAPAVGNLSLLLLVWALHRIDGRRDPA